MDVSETANNVSPLVSGFGLGSEDDEQLQSDIILMSASGFYTTQLTHSGAARADHVGHFISPPKCNSFPPKDRDDFKILIMCSLPLEADAIEALFDRRWDVNGDIYSKAPGDQNAYSTGVIGRHNVVLAHMPGRGKGNAASVATNCRSSFGGIKLALVVGICGGVPSNKDREEILLGDVIVSDGIIQYDLGGRYPDKFVRKDTLMDNLGRPNMEIRALLSKLKGRYGRKVLQEKMCEHLSILNKELAVAFPGVAEDKLFESNYRHKHQIPSSCATCDACKQQNDPVCDAAIKSTCEQLHCDEEKLVPRYRLFQIQADATSNQQSSICRPVVHFGLIASGDTVMKSGEHRDQIAAQEEVIAFEMEGAGVWDHFPCLIIKGVSDYADNHKSMKWQNYAAGTAAACMKAFLENWTVAGSQGNSIRSSSASRNDSSLYNAISTKLPTIPYLGVLGWEEGLRELGESFMPTPVTENTGLGRLGTYRETWMNLLVLFGAQALVSSKYAKRIPVDLDSKTVSGHNPLAVTLGLASWLAGLAGCTEIQFENGCPQFKGNTCALRFVSGGPFQMVGRYTQELGIPAYGYYSSDIAIMNARYARGSLAYKLQFSIPMHWHRSDELDGVCQILFDLHNSSGLELGVHSTSPAEESLRLLVIGLLAADSPESIRMFPVSRCRILDAAKAIANYSSMWNRTTSPLQAFENLPSMEYPRRTFHLTREGARRMNLLADRLESWIMDSDVGTYNDSLDILTLRLGWSWLWPTSGIRGWFVLLLEENPECPDEQLMRPKWPFDIPSDTFVLITEIIEAAEIFLSGSKSVAADAGWDDALFHTCVTAQLQELDFYLHTQVRALAAQEALFLIRNVREPGLSRSAQLDDSNEGGESSKESRSWPEDDPISQPGGDTLWARNLLSLRAILIGMLIQQALDLSSIIEIADRTVLLV